MECHDCGIKEGNIHHFGCDMEGCPFCGGQLISCGCCYDKLGIDASKGTWTYENGLTEEQTNEWICILLKKCRIPYVDIPTICVLCGKQRPEMFMDDNWSFYVIPSLQDKVLCVRCFERQKILFPKGWEYKSK